MSFKKTRPGVTSDGTDGYYNADKNDVIFFDVNDSYGTVLNPITDTSSWTIDNANAVRGVIATIFINAAAFSMPGSTIYWSSNFQPNTLGMLLLSYEDNDGTNDILIGSFLPLST